MLGGATSVRVVLQEMRITASDAPPPTAHQSLFRAPWNHRDILEYCTERSVIKSRSSWLRIFTVNLQTDFVAPKSSSKASHVRIRHAILRWRCPGQPFENAVKLRQRLKSDPEGDFANAQAGVMQKNARLFKSCPGNVIDKIDPGNLLELFAQIIRANVDRPCHLGQRKVFSEMFADKIPRFPDFDGLGLIPFPRI